MSLRNSFEENACAWLAIGLLAAACGSSAASPMSVPSDASQANPDSPDAGVDTDAGNAGSQPEADAAMTPAPSPDAAATYFRIVDLKLRDPAFMLGTTDITDTPLLGVSVNGKLIPDGLTLDYDKDGFVDVSMLIGLSPFGTGKAATELTLQDAHCKMSDLTQCEPDPKAVLSADYTAQERGSGTCLSPVAGTTTTFDVNKGVVPKAPCVSTTEGRDVTINLGGITMPMTGARVAATYDQSATPRLVDGLLQGFVTRAAAESTMLPSYLLVLGNTPLSKYLRASDADDGKGPNGEQGWWVYLNFVAEQVSYAQP